jgi:Tfp pilus tip-associated adhesin PilY1
MNSLKISFYSSYLATCALATVALAEDTNLSPVPMETQVQSAPPNIMFVLDNSGSMDWSMMSPETEGKFHSELYLWPMSDNDSGGSLSGDEKLEWKSQWSGYNKVYYNPMTTYKPWPKWNTLSITEDDSSGNNPVYNADLKNPRSNPIFRAPTLNLHDVYYSGITSDSNLATVIVDNEDGAPSYVEISGTTWDNSGRTPEWGSQSRWLLDNGEAVFTPNIPKAGTYTISAFWNCYHLRDENALFEIDIDGDGTADQSEHKSQRSTTDDTPVAGICGEWVPLFGGANFTLPAGSTARVSIIRNDDSTGDSTVADAVRFAPTGVEDNDILNAHYYVVDDSDGDGAEAGEVYLVNFKWTDTDNDSVVEDGEVLREYFSVSFDNDTGDHEDVTYLNSLTYDSTDPENDEVPAAIQPPAYDSDGNPSGYISDFQDLQNFANWFSFYRRRELTAKAAIASTIYDLEGVNVGYKTLHRTNTNGGAQQPVLPIKVNVSQQNDPNDLIIDDLDSTFTKSNNEWNQSSNTPEYDNSALKTRNNKNTAWAKWTPNITSAGLYTVSAQWSCNDNADKNAKITVHHSGGDTVDFYNQRASADNIITEEDCKDNNASSGCCGTWVNLGNFTFVEGTTGYVKLERDKTVNESSRTYADAVRFQKVGNASNSTSFEDSTDDLLSVLYKISSNGNTPLRTTLENVGKYFDQDDGLTGTIGNSPFYTEAQGGACQQTYAIAMTDGYWNGSDPSVNNADGAAGSPYSDAYPNTLADVAMYYYNQDLSSSLPNNMPTNNYDSKRDQHMVTFSVSFGLTGSIDPADIDGDGTPDSPSYLDDPYFLNPDTNHPSWPSTSSNVAKIDDLWHAAVNGRGRFFSANSPESLISSLKEMFEDISSRGASGASVSVNGDELSTGLELYQSSYTSGDWVGNVTAYPINPVTGEIYRTSEQILWESQDELQNQDWNTGRKIITYNGTNGIPFRYSELSSFQQKALANDSNLVEYLRGKEVNGFRSRNKKLGDIVHSAPLLISAQSPVTDGIDNDGDGSIDETNEKGGTIFVGSNDGMLHAFNAQTGKERFAYIPLHTFDYLHDLSDTVYSHRFYVDATPTFKRLTFFAGNQTADGMDNDGDGCVDGTDCPAGVNESDDGDNENYSDYTDNDGDSVQDEPWEKKTVTLLVGGLKKGGRGIYALDVSNADAIHGDGSTPEEESIISSMVLWEYPAIGSGTVEYTYAGDQTQDTIDNDNDGCTDGVAAGSCTDESANGDNENYSDSYDNDGDGQIDEEDEMWLSYSNPDDDMGYSFSDPFIVRSSITKHEGFSTTNHPWVVIFGNGYKSKNGSAVLYILDALNGTLIRKIDTGSGPNNGLSTPAIVDVDNDDRVDFVYAGDLKGNMWKFDLRDSDPENWGVAYGTEAYNPTGNSRIDYVDTDGTNHDIPHPLFYAPNRPITSAPDVMYHCDKQGYLVIFGTGKYLGTDDRSDTSQQSIFGIWDYGQSASQYLGEWSSSTNTLSNLAGVKLLEQTEIDWRTVGTTDLRTLSNNTPNWYLQCDDGIDNDADSQTDEADEVCIPASNTSYDTDTIDNNLNGTVDESGENIAHAGWFFNLPYKIDASSDSIDNDSDGTIDETDEKKAAGERVIKDVIIRDGKAIVISFIPDDSPCSGGGSSIVHELDACSGGRTDSASFDINDDGKIDSDDYIDIDGKKVAPTGMMHDGMLHTPVIVEDPDKERKREMKIFSNSAGTTNIMWENKEETGLYYWYER